MDSQKIKTQLRKIFTKKAKNQADIEELNRWYDSIHESTDNLIDINHLREESWGNILAEIESTSGKSSNNRRSIFGNWMCKAAIFLLLCGAGYGLLTVLPGKLDESVVAAGVFTNDIGKVSTFLLPDGSMVWLSSGSQLEYAEDFPRNCQVKLLGEAFFEVERNPKYPFRIATGALLTEVLGTTFNLESYDESSAKLSVYSGEVKFYNQKNSSNSSILLQGEQISWNSLSGFSDIHLFDFKQLPDWRIGKITFDNASINTIISTLKRWYNVDIKITGETMKCSYSGVFTQASLHQILESLTYALNLTYEINDANVTIHAMPCK
jgi:ferric-dicitrate binding protein FerR (iron transport regulator)